jgi:hypothetical protein
MLLPGARPTKAADNAGAKFNVNNVTIFKDIVRHRRRLTIELLSEIDVIKLKYIEECAELVDTAVVIKAWGDAYDMIAECLRTRLRNSALAKELIDLESEEGIGERLAGIIVDVQMELTYRFTERAKELSQEPVSDDRPIATAAIIFEILAKALKPTLK